MHVVTDGCLRPTPTDFLPILTDIQPANKPAKSIVVLDPAQEKRQLSRHPFVCAVRKLLSELSEISVEQNNGLT